MELHNTVHELITEGFAEVHDLQMQLKDHIAVIPLAFTSILLADETVWQCKTRADLFISWPKNHTYSTDLLSPQGLR